MATLVVAIVVTYNAAPLDLEKLIASVADQVLHLVIVDNGDGSSVLPVVQRSGKLNITSKALGANLGIAAAQNVGIAIAREHGAHQVLLFDHDSHPPADLVAKLQAALHELEKSGIKVAAVGPRFVDSKLSPFKVPSPFSRFKSGFISQAFLTGSSRYVAVDFLIASGSLIPLKALDEVGGMMESLFIDYVDIEWGLRARGAGWALFGIWDVVMEHSLGEDLVVVRGRAIPLHTPLRHYYAIRNVIWLATRSELGWRWKGGLAYNGLRRFIAYALFMPDRLDHVRYMCRGAWHAVQGRLGKM